MAVGRAPGVHKITGDAKARTITVDYESPPATVDGILRALDEIGFASTLAE